MAVRDPTGFVMYSDESDAYPRNNIYDTLIQDVLNDQVYALDCPQLIVSDFFDNFTVTGGAVTTVTQVKLRAKDMCSVSGVTTVNCKWCVYAYQTIGGATENFAITLSDGTTTSTITVSATHATPSWRGFSSSVAFITNDTEIVLTMQVNAGEDPANSTHVCGWMLVGEET